MLEWLRSACVQMLRLTPTNDTDKEKLAALRLERFRAYYNVLHKCDKCDIYLSSLDNALIINDNRMPKPGKNRTASIDYLGTTTQICLVKRLSCFFQDISCPQLTEELVMAAWLICAAPQIRIYRLGKLIAHGGIYNQGWKGNWKRRNMAISTEEVRNEINSELPDSKIIRSMALADIAADLEAPVKDLKAFLQEHNATLIDFQGTILVPENEAVTAYEHYSVIRARQKMQERLYQQQESKSLESSSKNDSYPPPATNKQKQKRTYLTWKGTFKVNKTSYKKTLQTALEALFPNSQSEQSAAINDISKRSDMGRAIVDKIARDAAYTDKASARENLFKAAEQLAQAEEALATEEVLSRGTTEEIT